MCMYMYMYVSLPQRCFQLHYFHRHYMIHMQLCMYMYMYICVASFPCSLPQPYSDRKETRLIYIV